MKSLFGRNTKRFSQGPSLFLIGTCFLFLFGCNKSDKREGFLFDKLELEQKNLKIHRSLGKRSTALKKLNSDKVISTKPRLFPLSEDKYEVWVNELLSIELKNTEELKSVDKRTPLIFAVNGKTRTVQLFVYRYKDNKRFLRIIRYDKESKDQERTFGLIRTEDVKVLFRSFQKLRKTNYNIPDVVTKGRYIVGDKKYPMDISQVALVKNMVNEFKANSYPFSGKLNNESLKSLGIGVFNAKGLKGHFEFYTDQKVKEQQKYQVFFSKTGSPFRARVWIRGDIEVLEGSFKSWDDLLSLEKSILTK